MSTKHSLRSWGILLILLFTVPVSRSERNVALTGTAEQSTDQSVEWTADKAIDNCTIQVIGPSPHCCAHTSAALIYKQAWWRVDLGQIITIQFITIYYRARTGSRFGGYSLNVSNSTNFIQSILCYQDTSSLREDVNVNPTHLCPYVARYVTVYNHREEPKRYDWYDDYAVLELCEVQVFGCPIESYGNHSCNNTCPESCYGGNCNAITGSCFYCFPGMYGDFCEQHCSANCNNICEKDTGHCIGCIGGNRGYLCDVNCPLNCVRCGQTSGQCIVCVKGKYGDACDFDCSDNCKDKTCMKDNGYCPECILGQHGNVCELDCSDSCKGKNCTKSNGHCIDCEDGFYGLECSPCSTGCTNPSCDKLSGNCSRCNNGFHGQKCDQSCPANCEDQRCIQNSGDCTGCDPGFHGSECYQMCAAKCANQTCVQDSGKCTECVRGLYGNDCSQTCPISCQDRCDRNTGACKACGFGKYGISCDLTCSSKCKNGKCKQIDGRCEGCKAGYYNDHCDRSCPLTCTTNICDQTTGFCTCPKQPDSFETIAVGIGIGSGVVILALVVLVIILVRRLSTNNGDNMSSTNMTDLSQSVRRHELQSSKDDTYENIGAYTIEPPIQTNTVDENYDQLDPLKREHAHVYETTKTAVL